MSTIIRNNRLRMDDDCRHYVTVEPSAGLPNYWGIPGRGGNFELEYSFLLCTLQNSNRPCWWKDVNNVRTLGGAYVRANEKFHKRINNLLF